MSDNEAVYAAIRKYQAAGDTANVGKLVNYLKGQPNRPAPAAATATEYNPAEGMSGPEVMAVSAVQAFKDIGTRVYDIMTPGNQDAGRASDQALMAPLKAAHPGWYGAGQMAPALATAPLPGGLVAQGLYGAGMGALSTDEDRGSAALGGGAMGAAGALAGTVIGKGVGAVRGAFSSSGRLGNLGQAAVDAGLPVTPAQGLAQSGVRSSLSKVEAAFESLPWTGIGAAKIGSKQKALLTQSAAKAIGQEADLLTPQVLDSASREIGMGIEDVTGKMRPFHLPPSLKEGLDKVITTEPFININTGIKMDGPAYAATRSALNDVSQKAWRAGDAPKAKYTDDIIDRLDDIAGNRGVDKAAHRQLRGQWRMLRTLERSNVITDGGVVSAKASKRALESVYGSTMKRGRLGNVSDEAGDFMAKSRALAELPAVSDSGTITRGSMLALGADVATTGGLGTIGSGLGAYGYYRGGQRLASGIGGAMEATPFATSLGGAVGRMAYGAQDVSVEELP